MMLNLEQLQQIDPQAIWLEITPSDLETAQPNAQLYSNPTGLHNATLNQLCLHKFRDWLSEIELEATASFNETDCLPIWDVVTGCSLNIGKTKIILIPTDTLDRDELRVPQEWVDLPNLLGDYYVAVQIDRDINAMNIWGFTSHRLLKQRGEYGVFDRSYSLSSDLLIPDLDILWMGQGLALNEISTVAELPNLTLDRALELIQELSVPSPYSPRTNIDWLDWGSLMNNSSLRAQLYQTRKQQVAIAQAPAPSFRLTDWLRGEISNAINSGWNHDYQPTPTRALNQQQEKIERSKLINLQVDLQQQSVVLLIGIVPHAAEQAQVQIQVYPARGQSTLPPQLQLNYVDEQGAILRTVTARSNDNYIQLPSFTCPIGTEFSIQLQLYSAAVIERLRV
jgi:Protein of unknown function (DUF1822)